MDALTVFIVVRRDLLKTLQWPVGSLIAQGCHATSAALWRFRQHAATNEYMSEDNIERMHKVVYEVKGEPQLQALAAQLETASIDHCVWREMPENMLTALATRPYRKSEVGDVFRKCSLFR
ncbi:hypothetical protein RI367_003508 [Sorochytrium milnesiophthora]